MATYHTTQRDSDPTDQRRRTNVSARHFGFLSDDEIWFSDENGLWLDSIGKSPFLIPDSAGSLNAVLWGKPADGYLMTHCLAWQYSGGSVIGPPIELGHLGCDVGSCGAPPFALMAAGPEWVARVSHGEVGVLRRPPPIGPKQFLALRADFDPGWKPLLLMPDSSSSFGVSRLVATVDGRHFAAVTPVDSHVMMAKPRSSNGVVVTIQPDGHPESGCLHPDGDLLAICSRSISLVGRDGLRLQTSEGFRRGAAFSRDGRYLIVGLESESVEPATTRVVAWDLVGQQARVIRDIPAGDSQMRIEFSPSGRLLGVSGRELHILDWNHFKRAWTDLEIVPMP